jgi:hypothetical protein
MSSAVMKWAMGPTGVKTTHFWGPFANWGLVGASAYNALVEPVEKASPKLTAVLATYSAVFMRFAWMVIPRNYLMLATHVANETVQVYQLGRIWRHRQGGGGGAGEPGAGQAGAPAAAGGGAGGAAGTGTAAPPPVLK